MFCPHSGTQRRRVFSLLSSCFIGLLLILFHMWSFFFGVLYCCLSSPVTYKRILTHQNTQVVPLYPHRKIIVQLDKVDTELLLVLSQVRLFRSGGQKTASWTRPTGWLPAPDDIMGGFVRFDNTLFQSHRGQWITVKVAELYCVTSRQALCATYVAINSFWFWLWTQKCSHET